MVYNVITTIVLYNFFNFFIIGFGYHLWQALLYYTCSWILSWLMQWQKRTHMTPYSNEVKSMESLNSPTSAETLHQPPISTMTQMSTSSTTQLPLISLSLRLLQIERLSSPRQWTWRNQKAIEAPLLTFPPSGRRTQSSQTNHYYYKLMEGRLPNLLNIC